MTRSVNDLRLRAQSLLQNALHGRNGSLDMSWMTPSVQLTAAVVIGVICIVLAVRGAKKAKAVRTVQAEKPDAFEKEQLEAELSWMGVGDAPLQKAEETANPYGDMPRISSWVEDDVDYAPYGSMTHDFEKEDMLADSRKNTWEEDDRGTVNPYAGGAAYVDDGETVNPYAARATGAAYVDDERTVDSYAARVTGAAYMDDERTVDPYAARAAGVAYMDEEKTVDPYAARPVIGMSMQGRRRMSAIDIDEEETVNPYLTNWMPQMTVGFLLESQQRQWKKEIAFTGSMWIGGTEKCELELDEPECENCCVELTHGGGNLYVRNVSRGGGTVVFNGEPLGDDLLPLQKGSELGIAGVRIRIERIDMAAFPR